MCVCAYLHLIQICQLCVLPKANYVLKRLPEMTRSVRNRERGRDRHLKRTWKYALYRERERGREGERVEACAWS